MTVEKARAPVPRVQLVMGILRRGDEVLLVREGLGADGALIEQAAFFPLPDAVQLLGELDSAPQREPVVGCLTGRVAPGATWPYRGRDETLVARW
ncbi:hypothetical protein [Streptomyces lydicus]|uniref:hypothetical protein n=1 Tax=Streptomyces lydicus TaxID=47763 RepID=UPI0037BB81A5